MYCLLQNSLMHPMPQGLFVEGVVLHLKKQVCIILNSLLYEFSFLQNQNKATTYTAKNGKCVCDKGNKIILLLAIAQVVFVLWLRDITDYGKTPIICLFIYFYLSILVIAIVIILLVLWEMYDTLDSVFIIPFQDVKTGKTCDALNRLPLLLLFSYMTCYDKIILLAIFSLFIRIFQN